MLTGASSIRPVRFSHLEPGAASVGHTKRVCSKTSYRISGKRKRMRIFRVYMHKEIKHVGVALELSAGFSVMLKHTGKDNVVW